MTIEWANKKIHVYKTDMLKIQDDPVEIYQLNIDDFRKQLNDLQDDPEGIPWPTTHVHYPPVSVSGVLLARVVSIINGYIIEFEDGLYNVNITGGNSNISDVTVKNSVGINTANSAGLQDSSTLQVASFINGLVALDEIRGVSGTTFPIGTRSMPVNNWQDAREIMEINHLTGIIVLGIATVGQDDDISSIQVFGTNPMTSIISIADEAETTNTYIRECYFAGTLDGGAVIRDCVLGEVQYFSGYIEHCVLTSNTIYAHGEAIFLNCDAGKTQGGDAVVDVSEADYVAVRGFIGEMTLKNMVTDIECDIGIDGRLTIDSSCTAGTVYVYGDGYVVNNSANVTVIDRTTGSPEEVADAVWSKELP